MVKNITAEFKSFSGLDIDKALLTTDHIFEDYTFYNMAVGYKNQYFEVYSGVKSLDDLFRIMVNEITRPFASDHTNEQT